MSLILKLEAMAGDTIGDACFELVSVAERLNVCAQLEFNGVTLMSYSGGDASELAHAFAEKVSSKDKYKFACTHGKSKLDGEPVF